MRVTHNIPKHPLEQNVHGVRADFSIPVRIFYCVVIGTFFVQPVHQRVPINVQPCRIRKHAEPVGLRLHHVPVDEGNDVPAIVDEDVLQVEVEVSERERWAIEVRVEQTTDEQPH